MRRVVLRLSTLLVLLSLTLLVFLAHNDQRGGAQQFCRHLALAQEEEEQENYDDGEVEDMDDDEEDEEEEVDVVVDDEMSAEEVARQAEARHRSMQQQEEADARHAPETTTRAAETEKTVVSDDESSSSISDNDTTTTTESAAAILKTKATDVLTSLSEQGCAFVKRAKKLSSSDVKKIAAGVLGVWGVSVGAGWLAQNIHKQPDVQQQPVKTRGRK